uniref:Uncharacterized protein n=1 Tax=Chromera velia CCMP2878 TaxID=1169474 RepID=A0A0G4HV12_9ALVE|eukprot:Cvel_8770.t1-p1 / transcript=Cvel_8770.t1 / gene=Cvel_8770 / organism=Chromera_velia_CCMP2878 / gene_product=DNA mismatch repair protein MSH5, putative / transcript_product=DNA mismatch repair protein MSH5, putative / location=Cvel_scaffold490:55508-56144(-) / protein_length=155 / sequence_SO=supercontig / SO=protein_coding / is_pseudo=false
MRFGTCLAVALQRLQSLPLSRSSNEGRPRSGPGLDMEMQSFDQKSNLDAHMDTQGMQSVRAAGGLLANVTKGTFLDELDDQPTIERILHFALSSLVSVDAVTFSALQIFQEDAHPSQIKGIGRSKEGVSVFGLFEQFVESAPGKNKLRWDSFCLS